MRDRFGNSVYRDEFGNLVVYTYLPTIEAPQKGSCVRFTEEEIEATNKIFQDARKKATKSKSKKTKKGKK